MNGPRCELLYDKPSLYDLVVTPGPCEAFYRGLARQAGGPVLELACGTGRLTIPLALDGHEVTGVDASPSMLRAARAKASAQRIQLDLRHGDMRSFEFGKSFALIIVSCNSLAHLTDNRSLGDCLARIARHLAPRGIFAFDVVNPSVAQLAGQRRLDATAQSETAGEAVSATKRLADYDPVRQVQTFEFELSGPGTRQERLAPMRLRTFFPQELPPRLELAGMELAARNGDFEGGQFTGSSPNQVCVARKMQ